MGLLSGTYIFQAEELVASVFSERARVLEHLLQRGHLRRRILLLLTRGILSTGVRPALTRSRACQPCDPRPTHARTPQQPAIAPHQTAHITGFGAIIMGRKLTAPETFSLLKKPAIAHMRRPRSCCDGGSWNPAQLRLAALRVSRGARSGGSGTRERESRAAQVVVSRERKPLYGLFRVSRGRYIATTDGCASRAWRRVARGVRRRGPSASRVATPLTKLGGP